MNVQDRKAPRVPARAAPSTGRGDLDEGVAELRNLILGDGLPAKEEIMRVKALIRELASRSDVPRPRADEAEAFIAAYLDLYLGRICGEAGGSRASLKRCLGYLGAGRRSAAPQADHPEVRAATAPRPTTASR